MEPATTDTSTTDTPRVPPTAAAIRRLYATPSDYNPNDVRVIHTIILAIVAGKCDLCTRDIQPGARASRRFLRQAIQRHLAGPMPLITRTVLTEGYRYALAPLPDDELQRLSDDIRGVASCATPAAA